MPDKVRLMLRRQALGWLRDDLAVYTRLAKRDDPKAKEFVRQRLELWQQGDALASVRDRKALEQLPDDERRQWRQLWDEAARLLAQVGAASP